MELSFAKYENDGEYQVKIEYDKDAGVWIATSDDIVGLVLESESFDELFKKVLTAAPELIELNNLPKKISIRFSMNLHERLAIA